jgi:hypothetical protein
MRNGCDIFDPTDPETCSRQHSNRGLSTRTGRSGSMSARRPYSNVKSCDASVLCRPCRCTSRLHRRIWRTLKSICFDVLSTGASGNSLCSSKVSNMHQCVVERGVDVRDTPTFNAFLRDLCFLLLSRRVVAYDQTPFIIVLSETQLLVSGVVSLGGGN